MTLRANCSAVLPARSLATGRPAPLRPGRIETGLSRPSLGNQALQHLLRSGAIQPKLTVNQPGDAYEQEADRVAESVMRMPAPGAAPAITPLAEPDVQRKCAECAAEEEKEKEKEEVQREATGPAPVAANPRVEAQVRSLEGGGSALAPDVRGFFEPRFGRDLSAVRIHTEGPAAESALELQARAYTRGHHVVFAAGEYAPHSSAGRRLLAHELTHVAQQEGLSGGLARMPVQRQCTTATIDSCSEDDLLTAVCIGEAGLINDDDGKKGPMNVVINRTKDKLFGSHSTIKGQARLIIDAEVPGKKGTDPGMQQYYPRCNEMMQKVKGGDDPTQGAVFYDQCCERPCEQFCTGYLGDGTIPAHFFARRATAAETAACRDNAKNSGSSCNVCGSQNLQAHCDKRCCTTGSKKGAVPGYPGTKTSATEETPGTPEAPRETAPQPNPETPASAPAASATQ